MSIWDQGKRRFMFRAYKGHNLPHIIELRRQLRANQLRNEAKAQLLTNKSMRHRRRALRPQPVNPQETVKKPFDPTPFMTPPNEG